MRLGYNTNGFAHHRLQDALEILADIGYESVAITLDYGVLNPFDADIARSVEETRRLLERHRLRSVIETGARFLLDPRSKHQPTLVSSSVDERSRRIDLLRRAVEIAAALGSDAVSFWSGPLCEDLPRGTAMDRLVAGCGELLSYAVARGVRLAFEPEPGMFIERMSDYAELAGRLDHPLFGLTVDVGHVHCLSDGSIPEVLGAWKKRLFNLHIEDMRRGVHDHLMFGEGEIDFLPVMAKLAEIGYAGGVHVELSRHSHDAVAVSRRAFQFLSELTHQGSNS